MSALFILIAIAYLNGDPVQTQAGDLYPDQGKCSEAAHQSAAQAAKQVPAELQLVYKCVDLSQVPNVVSAFGQAKSL